MNGRKWKLGDSGAKRRGAAKQEAILLLGPTGSGKSPLGQALEKQGLSGKRCVHFDFGANLREVAGLKRRPAGFTVRDMCVIRDSLRTGALLENENFPVAEKIMARFGRKRRLKKGDVLILNGLPRHEGQVADLDRTVRVSRVIYLDASLATIRERIRRDTGGDRGGRTDDSPEETKRKYATFRKRTQPLIDYYAGRGARIQVIRVSAGSTSGDMLLDISGR